MNTRTRLFVMMVLEFFIWGAWLPLIFGYLPSLGFTPGQQSLILSAFPVASIVGMFFSNQWADKSPAPEKVLAISHLIGGLAILGCGFTRDFLPFFILMLVHCLLYVPTISITNSIAFANMKNADKEFGIVRMGGTIGWILAAWPFVFVFVNWDAVAAANTSGIVDWLGTALANPLTGDAAKAATKWTYIVAGMASLLLAGFSLTLPKKPVATVKDAAAATSNPWATAFGLLKHPYILVLWLVTLVDSFVHNCYFNWTGVFLGTAREAGGVGIASNWITPVMSIGQVFEILTMFILGATLKNLGWRTTMVVGILGHAARFAVYALFPQSAGLIILVQVLHGVCYAFFFATVYIFVDAHCPKNIRTSAQGLFNLQILGIGALLANVICPWLMQSVYTSNGITDFRGLFMVPLAAASLAAIGLALFFRPPTTGPSDAVKAA
ncbi:MAG: MFS transporter [Acidobacteria bacterium]|nr:MFS transporter [Acidobacteriota bacterium]MBP8273998.1 MFS transporter [Acidobacteriota bacterium]